VSVVWGMYSVHVCIYQYSKQKVTGIQHGDSLLDYIDLATVTVNDLFSKSCSMEVLYKLTIRH